MLLLGLAAVAFPACGYPGDVDPYRPPAYYEPPPPPDRPDPVLLGRYLYLRDCAFCHDSDGEGTERGPDLVTGTNGPALHDFMLRTGRMPIDDEMEETKHDEPVYSQDEIAAIVEYMARAFPAPGPEIPDVDPLEGDISEGQQLYQQYCAACHATTGIGGAMLTQRGRDGIGGTTGIIIPPIDRSTPVEIAEAVRTGPGTMPVFGPQLVSDDELDSVVRYTLYLSDPPDPGGAPIGHVGPVVEGAVGWVLGLGTLVLVIRWVGTKAGDRA